MSDETSTTAVIANAQRDIAKLIMDECAKISDATGLYVDAVDVSMNHYQSVSKPVPQVIASIELSLRSAGE